MFIFVSTSLTIQVDVNLNRSLCFVEGTSDTVAGQSQINPTEAPRVELPVNANVTEHWP